MVMLLLLLDSMSVKEDVFMNWVGNEEKYGFEIYIGGWGGKERRQKSPK